MSPIVLRRATPQDAAELTRLMSDPAVYSNLMQLPHTSESHWVARLADSTRPAHDLLLLAEREGQLVGSAGLHPAPQVRRRHAAMLGISVAAAAQGQGVGRALMQAVCDYADRWVHVLRIELTVFADNERAIALYRQFGFEHEGLHRAYALRNGRYVDACAMARLHPDPPILPAPAAQGHG